jgi:hypothetical protein
MGSTIVAEYSAINSGFPLSVPGSAAKHFDPPALHQYIILQLILFPNRKPGTLTRHGTLTGILRCASRYRPVLDRSLKAMVFVREATHSACLARTSGHNDSHLLLCFFGKKFSQDQDPPSDSINYSVNINALMEGCLTFKATERLSNI